MSPVGREGAAAAGADSSDRSRLCGAAKQARRCQARDVGREASLTSFPGARRLSGRALWRRKERCADDAQQRTDASERHRGSSVRRRMKRPRRRRRRVAGPASAVESVVRVARGGDGGVARRAVSRGRRGCAHRPAIGAARHDRRSRSQCRIEQRLEAGAADAPHGDDRGHRPEGAEEGGGTAHGPGR